MKTEEFKERMELCKNVAEMMNDTGYDLVTCVHMLAYIQYNLSSTIIKDMYRKLVQEKLMEKEIKIDEFSNTEWITGSLKYIVVSEATLIFRNVTPKSFKIYIVNKSYNIVDITYRIYLLTQSRYLSRTGSIPLADSTYACMRVLTRQIAKCMNIHPEKLYFKEI